MADRSTIEWTEATWNPTTGCDQVSAGFDAIADMGQLDIDQIAELALGVIGNADAHLIGVLDAHPFVGFQEFQITGYLAHGSVTCVSRGIL